MQYKCVVYIVQCSMGSMKCTGAVAGAFADAGTVHSVHCAVCNVRFLFRSSLVSLQEVRKVFWVKRHMTPFLLQVMEQKKEAYK